MAKFVESNHRDTVDYIPDETFSTVVAVTPLVSIDLVVRNKAGQVLLGKRNNRPAQEYWFVPGGRIRKNESVVQAFERLCRDELGVFTNISQARYIGLYEHFYEDCVFSCSRDSAGTHYVVNGFELELVIDIASLPNEQHNQYQWFDEAVLLGSHHVHEHSKWYFQNDKGFL